MNIVDRLKMYSALAAAPCAVIGGIPVKAFAAPDPGGITAQLNGTESSVSVDAFTAAGLQFQAFMFKASLSSLSIGGLQLAPDDRGSTYGGNFYGLASKMKFFAVDSRPFHGMHQELHSRTPAMVVGHAPPGRRTPTWSIRRKEVATLASPCKESTRKSRPSWRAGSTSHWTLLSEERVTSRSTAGASIPVT